MIRDNEIRRLRKYAHGLGCSIVIMNKDGIDCSGECWGEGRKIFVYKSQRTSKTDLVLTIIHELAHWISFVNDGYKLDERFRKSLEKQHDNTPISNADRRRAYLIEARDQQYWDQIIKYCEIKIPRYKIEIQKEIDLLWYELDYLTNGNYTNADSNNIIKTIKRRYAKGNR